MLTKKLLTTPRLVALCPWSDTNKRLMLSILGDAEHSTHGTMALLACLNEHPKKGFIGLLSPIPEDWEGDSSSTPRFFSISWSPRSPTKLHIQSRAFTSLHSAQSWGHCGVQVRAPAMVLTLEVLSPTFSLYS